MTNAANKTELTATCAQLRRQDLAKSRGGFERLFGALADGTPMNAPAASRIASHSGLQLVWDAAKSCIGAPTLFATYLAGGRDRPCPGPARPSVTEQGDTVDAMQIADPDGHPTVRARAETTRHG